MDTSTPRFVSLLPRDMTSENPGSIVEALAAYENLADRDHTYSIAGLPAYVKRALNLLRTLTPRKRSLQDTSAFAIEAGLEHLERVPGRESLVISRQALLAVGADEISFFEDWDFKLNAQHEDCVRLWTRLSEDVEQRVNLMGDEVGLTTKSPIAALAIISVLIHVPGLPDHLKRQMVEELVAFGRKLKARAATGRQLAAKARPTSTSLTVTFDEVLNRIQRGS